MAAIYALDGNELTTGLQGCDVCDEAILAAEAIADQRNETVHLVDDDGEWLVTPAVDGVREPAWRIADAVRHGVVVWDDEEEQY